MKVIVIGGVAAGMSAASKIARMDKTAEITVYEKRGFLSYGACGLPYYVGGQNDDYRRMIARTKEQFDQMGVRSFLHHELEKVDFDAKTVWVKDLESGEVFTDRYDRLMISTGAEAVVPNLKGKEMMGVHVLKSMEDGIFLKELAKQPQIKNVVIIGGGYIGVECADVLLSLGKNVRVIEASSRILAPFDEELAELAMQELQRNGVMIHLNEKAQEFVGGGYVKRVVTDQATYPADLVIVAVGIRPATGFLKNTGIKLAENGAIFVDREMKTSIPDVYAAGDCAMTWHRTTGNACYQALGTVANKCGRLAGNNMAGGNAQFAGVLGSSAIKICQMELGRTGLGEAEARSRGYDYSTTLIGAYDHPAYYPDPTPITIKLIYEKKTHRILGAQAWGQKGAVLRVDIFAVAIHCGMTTEELGMTDLIYAPPFAGVWDAVQIACNASK
jgi:NADPH-dependent 2,4-dienoyl-CoA reductase/sulfur reductase-like enzyme